MQKLIQILAIFASLGSLSAAELGSLPPKYAVAISVIAAISGGLTRALTRWGDNKLLTIFGIVITLAGCASYFGDLYPEAGRILVTIGSLATVAGRAIFAANPADVQWLEEQKKEDRTQ